MKPLVHATKNLKAKCYFSCSLFYIFGVISALWISL